jgi:hypothetical protein
MAAPSGFGKRAVTNRLQGDVAPHAFVKTRSGSNAGVEEPMPTARRFAR